MSETIIKAVNELLNKEKWTRATLNSYSINNFKELDTILEETPSDEEKTEIKKTCDEHLVHSKNSIIALYLSGITALNQQMIDDSSLIMLINIFTDNHKWNIVEYLCLKILEFGENKYALRTLSECYENNNEHDKKFKIWERLIKVDYEEAEIIKILAEKREEEKNIEEAVGFYKKAIHRFINKKSFSRVKEIWTKLVEYVPDEIDFFFHTEKKIAKALNTERSSMLLYMLIPHFKQNQKWDTCINILKKILKYNSKDAIARKDIAACYAEKYKDHSQLKEYIKLSNLNQSWRNVHDAILDFEKHISFDKGNYVYHRSWGIGKIVEIKDDIFIIDFSRKKGHKMSLKMAVNALKILGDDHIWVLKVTMTREKLKEKIMSDISWALKIIIHSFENVAEMKRVKGELVPSVLTPAEWAKWNIEARKVLKTDTSFGNLPDRLDQFEIREAPISFEEKTFNKFKAEKQFYQRVQTILDFLKHSEPDSDYFGEMFSYFVSFCKSFTVVNEYIISSYMLINKIIIMYPFLNPGLNFKFKDLFEQADDFISLFSKIADSELKREFLANIKKYINNWPDIYIKLFKHYQTRYIIDELLSNNKQEKIKELFLAILDHYKELREAFVWLVRNIADEPWFVSFEIPAEKIMICMIHLLDISYREITNRRAIGTNRKINKQILDFLFKTKTLENCLADSDQDSITRLYTLVDDIKDLDPGLKVQLRHTIKEKFPEFKFLGEKVEPEKAGRRRLMVTRESYERKQRDLKYLLETEIPQNSKEIGLAMEKGDLRENAEYKAALEKQDLLNSVHAKLQEELKNAQIFDTSKVDTEIVSFGTKACLTNLTTNTKEDFIILGPWESDPEHNTISYLSPLGIKLCNNKAGTIIKFVINEKELNYKIDRIERVI